MGDGGSVCLRTAPLRDTQILAAANFCVLQNSAVLTEGPMEDYKPRQSQMKVSFTVLFSFTAEQAKDSLCSLGKTSEGPFRCLRPGATPV